MRVLVNGRFHSRSKTGMQHYASEVTRRIGSRVELVSPVEDLHGARGHLWEQCYLPTVSHKHLLWSPNNTGPLAARRQICTIHDLFPVEHPEWFSSGFANWYRWLLPKLARRLEHIVAVSEYTKQRIVERFGIRPEKITVVHNGVDATFFPRSPEDIALAREQYGIPFENYVLTVGGFVERKNITRLLKAWSLVAAQTPETGLVVVGPPVNARVSADLNIGALPPNVHFTGYVAQEHLPSLYSGATVLACPSLAEGFGLPLLEAMACGTPVVASNTTALPEVGGDCAVWIDPYDVESIADGILQLTGSASLRQSLRRRGLARSREFTWERTAADTWKVLEAFA